MRLRIAEMAREKRGWNMRRLADELDLDHQTVLYWNQGRTNPRLPMVIKLLRLLGCNLEELVSEEPSPPYDPSTSFAGPGPGRGHFNLPGGEPGLRDPGALPQTPPSPGGRKGRDS
jgi:DNA-binding XRE family transcriptional regulator